MIRKQPPAFSSKGRKSGRTRLSHERSGTASIRIFADDSLMVEIRDLKVTHLRFKKESPLLIGPDVPMPLYWWQYANHEDPENNSGSDPEITILEDTEKRISFSCSGLNRSGSIISRYDVDFFHSEELHRFVLRVHAELHILQGKQWQLSHNPDHGEIEFCNFWPHQSYIPETGAVKRYQTCLVHSGDRYHTIPHHHLETRDKKNIVMNRNDRFVWLLEDDNPVLELLSSDTIHAGLCAYMWDAHFGYRNEGAAGEMAVQGPARCSAEYRLYSIDRDEGLELLSKAPPPDFTLTDAIPIYTHGIQSFSDRLMDMPAGFDRYWPWEFSVSKGKPDGGTGLLVHDSGYGDNNSLKIENTGGVQSHWAFTALGAAFGGDTFSNGVRLKLSAWIRTKEVIGAADIAIRLHRHGIGDLFRIDDYDVYSSDERLHGTSDWRRLECITPPISPAPDRVHLLLRLHDAGVCWFDDALFEVV
jgi:hypothetical protein